MRQTTKVILPENSDHANADTLSGPRLAHVTEQPGLPIRFDSKRGCDQIRARLYHDPRLVGLELTVALALSEFVRLPACVAYPKQSLLAKMVKSTQPKVSGALSRLEAKRVLGVDRCRTYCRYVFLASWRGQFVALQGGESPRPRYTQREYQDIPRGNITGEPYVLEPLRTLIAAADVSALHSGRDDQQQQQRRIDGQIASCEISARVLDVDFDAADHRERMQSGELSLEESQAFTDGLRLQRDDRTRRKGTAR